MSVGEKVHFGEVVRKVNNKVKNQERIFERFVAGRHIDKNDIKLRRWGYVNEGYLGPAFSSIFTSGQVLYVSRRTYLRKIAVADFDGICSNTTFVLESANSDRLLPGFLPILMSTENFHNFSELNSKGSVTPYINFSDLAKFEFVLPSILKQKQLVELFNNMQSKIHHLRMAMIDIDMIISKSIDRYLHLGELKLKNNKSGKSDDRLADWRNLSVGDFTLTHKQGYYSSQKYSDSGSNLIRITDLKNPYIDITSSPLVEIDKKTLDSFRVKKGDFLFARSGTIGTYGIAEKDYDAVFASYIIRFRFDSEIIDPHYFGLFFHSSYCKRQLPAVTQSAVNTNINARNIKTLRCLIPNLDLQRTIVSKLTSLTQKKESLELMIDKTQKLCDRLMENEVIF